MMNDDDDDEEEEEEAEDDPLRKEVLSQLRRSLEPLFCPGVSGGIEQERRMTYSTPGKWDQFDGKESPWWRLSGRNWVPHQLTNCEPQRNLAVVDLHHAISIRVRIWGKGSHPASCKHKLVGFWKPLLNRSVFGNFGPCKKHRFLASTFDSNFRHHFVRWQLSSWYECCIPLKGPFYKKLWFQIASLGMSL